MPRIHSPAPVTLYTFDELSDTAKQKAIEVERSTINIDYDWYSFINEEFISALEKIGFLDVNTLFSGFWSQGDGASFTGEFDSRKLDLTTLENYPAIFEIYQKHAPALTCDLLADKNNYFTATLKRTGSNYVHERTVIIDGLYLQNDDMFLCEEDDADQDAIFQQEMQLQAILDALRLELCQYYYNLLEKEYEYLHSDACISENLISNKVEFTEDGSVYQ